MPAPKGNQFWKLRSKHGRDKIFSTPEELWNAACEYFEWCDENPIKEEKIFHSQGVITKGTIKKIRAYTLKDFCLFCGVNEAYLRQFESNENKDFSTVITRIQDIVYSHQFGHAAVDMLNPNIIARNLGLKEQVHSTNENKNDLGDKTLDELLKIANELQSK